MSDWEIQGGDVLERLREMPTGSVHAVVTSPPYFGLRDYGIAGQIGLEATPEAFIARMVEVFREVRRVLRHDGTCFVNLGDSYVGGGGYYPDAPSNQAGSMQANGNRKGARNVQGRAKDRSTSMGLKPKDLMMMPARVALALQADGWWLRSEITWCKRAPMPESVTDRPTSATEKIYLLTKSARYFYDADAVREPHNPAHLSRYNSPFNVGEKEASGAGRPVGAANTPGLKIPNPAGRNMWNWWALSPEPYAAAHFATFPSEIPRRAILAGTSERGACAECGAPWRRVVEREFQATQAYNNGKRYDPEGVFPSHGWQTSGRTLANTTGWQPTCRHTDAPTVPCTVLDPFSGAGTTVMVALRLGRRGVGIELNPEYVAMSRERIIGDAPMFNTPLEQSA